MRAFCAAVSGVNGGSGGRSTGVCPRVATTGTSGVEHGAAYIERDLGVVAAYQDAPLAGRRGGGSPPHCNRSLSAHAGRRWAPFPVVLRPVPAHLRPGKRRSL